MSTERDNGPRKGALMRDGSFWSEGIYGLGCGLAYGMTSAVVGQPLDSVKTKMQAQAVYKNMSMFKTFGHVIKTEGVIGLYRGILPPLVGSSIFRSVQFGAYNFAWAGLGQNFPSTLSHIPGTELESRVILGSIFASGIRSVIECPLELIKVRQMTGQPWTVSQLFSGFNVLFFRTCGLLATFFIGVDYATRYIPDLITTPYIGPFIKGGVGSTLGWMVIWPFETIKNQIQANTEGPKNIMQRLFWVGKEQGLSGLYRGFLPGASRSLIANGISMLVFEWCQNLRAKHVAASK